MLDLTEHLLRIEGKFGLDHPLGNLGDQLGDQLFLLLHAGPGQGFPLLLQLGEGDHGLIE
ncbi:hypothetical protein D3C85_1516610 [compost metagenome]